MNTTLDTLTVGQAKEIIDSTIQSFVLHQFGYSDFDIKPEVYEVIAYAIDAELDLRDYLLGIPNELDADSAGSVSLARAFVDEAGASVDASHSAPFWTISAFFSFELGNMYEVKTKLKMAFAIDPDYALATLIERVVQAGWEPESIARMRSELHGQVKEKLNNDYERIVGVYDED